MRNNPAARCYHFDIVVSRITTVVYTLKRSRKTYSENEKAKTRVLKKKKKKERISLPKIDSSACIGENRRYSLKSNRTRAKRDRIVVQPPPGPYSSYLFKRTVEMCGLRGLYYIITIFNWPSLLAASSENGHSPRPARSSAAVSRARARAVSYPNEPLLKSPPLPLSSIPKNTRTKRRPRPLRCGKGPARNLLGRPLIAILVIGAQRPPDESGDFEYNKAYTHTHTLLCN